MERKVHRLTFYHPLLEKLSGCFRGKTYLVGGFVRDRIIRVPREGLDIDIATEDDPASVRGCASEVISTSGFAFEREKRVVSFVKGGVRVDISGILGASIEDDLSRRDFTIDAMAVSLFDVVSPLTYDVELIDPFGGFRDLEMGILKPVSETSIVDDPVRILRGIRLKAKLNLSYADSFKAQVDGALNLLESSPPERLRDEVIKMLNLENTHLAFRDMFELSVIYEVFPEFRGFENVPPSGLHQFNLIEHTLRTVEYVPGVVERRGEILGEEFYGSVGRAQLLPELSDIEALKLSALFHDVAKPETMKWRRGRLTFYGHDLLGARISREAALRLSFGRKVADFLFAVIRNHLRPFFLFNERKLSGRAKFNFFRDCGNYPLHVLLLSVADWMATSDSMRADVKRYEEFVREMAVFYRRIVETEPILSGDEIMEIKGFKEPNRCVGRIKEKLFEMQVLGMVSERDEAIKLVRGFNCESSPEG